ncbi:DUF1073 domain-containing protein [Pantoea sp. S62]|nr:DUF1073 domain-containing protein [Pantoea sp. S62]
MTSGLPARAMAFNPGMGLDAKRESAWCEYGFKDELTFDDLHKLYRRGGIAHGAVNKLVSNCWRTNPQVIEGEQSDDSRELTAWEKASNQVFTHRFWRAFAEADKRRLVGRWAGILLHIRDSRKWDQPAVKGKALQKITPVWASALKVGSRDNSGSITMWQYTESLTDGSTAQRNIHPDRVLIIGDMSDDAIGFLEPGSNACVSLEKVEGGSGESFLKNAARQQNINFDKEVDFNNLASMYGVTVDELQERYNEAAGVTVTPATASLAVGATRQLTGTVQPTDATDRTGTWTTSDATKATVSSTGLVTAVAAGSATITFRSNDGNFTGSTAVTVTAS